MLRPVIPAASAFLLAAAALPSVVDAQDHHQHGTPETLGRVEFPTSCSVQAQPRFERALALLHSFWWEEAHAAFTEVAALDSTCAMAHWGLALTWWNNPFGGGPGGNDLAKGAAAAARAARISAPTERERDYIAAIVALYRDHETARASERLQAYSDAMATVYARNPSDPEAAIYYALSLVATASPTDTTFARQKRANEILNPLFLARPDHPGIAHYIIHANDSPPLAQYGLDAARRYAAIAPSVPHAQHMPSHIFIRLGMWEENIASNQRSYDAGVAYIRATSQTAIGSHEFHAADYVVYGHLQLGRDTEARRVTEQLVAQTEVVPPRTLISEYARAAMPARLVLERDRWQEAAQLPILTEGLLVPTMVTRFARGIGAARSGDHMAARSEASELASIETSLAEARDTYWSRTAGIKRRAVEAWAAFAAGDTAAALAAAAEAADLEAVTGKHPVTPGEVLPARELHADMLLAAGRFAEAHAAYEATLTREPNRARALFGAGAAALHAGDAHAAQTFHERYLALMANADPGVTRVPPPVQ
jgi:hypothetical protein